MSEGEMFTDAVNYKHLANRLRRDGHVAVPEHDELKRAAQKEGGVQLVEWLLDKLEQNEGNFQALMALTLTHAGVS